jgi:N-acetylglucosamine malate deacetylase 1
MWVTGSAGRPHRRWHSPGKQRVLVVASHPDDELAGCGGTILLHREAGDHVSVLHVTDGRRSRALAATPTEVAYHRRVEARDGVAALDVSHWEWLGLPEGDWADQQLAEPLDRIIRELAPDIIYLPSRIDFHPEHYRVARVAAGVLRVRQDSKRIIRVYQVQVPLTAALVNLVASIESVFPTVLDAHACYASQEPALRAPLRLRTYAASAQRNDGRLEEFWEMGDAGYVALHAREPDEPLIKTFRGLRRSPLTDLLAYVRGRTERRRLAALVSDVGG